MTSMNFNKASVEILLQRLDRVERQLQALEKKEACKGSVQCKDVTSVKERMNDNITIVGLREAIGSRQCGIRLLWLSIFFVCLLSMGYFVFKIYTEYVGEPTATKVKLIEENNYEYPSMLFCPDTWLDAEKAVQDGLTMDGLQYALGYLINYYVNPPPYRIDNYTRAQSDFYAYYNERRFPDLVEFFKSISLDSDVFFYKCPFCRNHTFNKVLMSESICYEILMHPSPGHAPVVSSLDMFEVIVPDRTAGLLTPKSYWKLFLGSDLRLGESTRKYAEIYPRQTNTIQFITHRFISVDKEGSHCLDTIDSYSHAGCVVQCFVEKYGGLMFLMTACSTSDSSCDNRLLTPKRTFHFYPENLWDRLSFIHQNEKGGEEAPAHCYQRCPSLCERMIYTINVQSHPITKIIDLRPPTLHRPGYRSSISTPENLTRIYLLNSAAVYGGVLTFKEVSTYSFETMVGNVGGMLSLWMGISIMSIIQLIMFFTTEWCHCKRTRHDSINGAIAQNGIIIDSPVNTTGFVLQASAV